MGLGDNRHAANGMDRNESQKGAREYKGVGGGQGDEGHKQSVCG